MLGSSPPSWEDHPSLPGLCQEPGGGEWGLTSPEAQETLLRLGRAGCGGGGRPHSDSGLLSCQGPRPAVQRPEEATAKEGGTQVPGPAGGAGEPLRQTDSGEKALKPRDPPVKQPAQRQGEQWVGTPPPGKPPESRRLSGEYWLVGARC